MYSGKGYEKVCEKSTKELKKENTGSEKFKSNDKRKDVRKHT